MSRIDKVSTGKRPAVLIRQDENDGYADRAAVQRDPILDGDVMKDFRFPSTKDRLRNKAYTWAKSRMKFCMTLKVSIEELAMLYLDVKRVHSENPDDVKLLARRLLRHLGCVEHYTSVLIETSQDGEALMEAVRYANPELCVFWDRNRMALQKWFEKHKAKARSHRPNLPVHEPTVLQENRNITNTQHVGSSENQYFDIVATEFAQSQQSAHHPACHNRREDNSIYLLEPYRPEPANVAETPIPVYSCAPYNPEAMFTPPQYNPEHTQGAFGHSIHRQWAHNEPMFFLNHGIPAVRQQPQAGGGSEQHAFFAPGHETAGMALVHYGWSGKSELEGHVHSQCRPGPRGFLDFIININGTHWIIRLPVLQPPTQSEYVSTPV